MKSAIVIALIYSLFCFIVMKFFWGVENYIILFLTFVLSLVTGIVTQKVMKRGKKKSSI